MATVSIKGLTATVWHVYDIWCLVAVRTCIATPGASY